MSAEFATAVSDVILSLGTLFLTLKFKGGRGRTAWRAFFFALAASAGFGALYHGMENFKAPSFWVLVSAASMTSSFLFFAACAISGKPSWRWLSWSWPFFALGGIVAGVALSTSPFWMITASSTVIIFASLYVLQGSPSKECRQWIMLGIGVTILGFIVQMIFPKEGALNNNVLFHFFQLAGNFCLWFGAKKA